MALKLCTPPKGTFRGKNFMTPGIVGYYKLRSGYAELSTGEGLTRQPIFGVTLVGIAAESKLFHSRLDALDYIESLS